MDTFLGIIWQVNINVIFFLKSITPPQADGVLKTLINRLLNKREDINMENEANLICFTIMPSGSHNEYKDGETESNFIYDEIIHNGVIEASEKLNQEIISIREVDRRKTGSITKRIILSG